MRRTKASDSAAGPGSMRLNRRSKSNSLAETRFGGSLTGRGDRSMPGSVLTLPLPDRLLLTVPATAPHQVCDVTLRVLEKLQAVIRLTRDESGFRSGDEH